MHVGCKGHITARACNSPDTCLQDTDSLHERKRTILIQSTHLHSNINTYPAAHSHVGRCMVANSPSLASNRYTVYTLIRAKRLKRFLLQNNIITPTLLKGFLSGINGTVEHIFSICSILDKAIQHGLPLAMSFLNLRNAFGSESHLLIRDILHHVHLPSKFVIHVTNSYAQLSGLVKTKRWHTPSFRIKRGVFQSNTLLPLILLAFNPRIKLCKNLSSCGFSLKLLVPDSSGIPPTNTAIYVEWNEASSNEPSGWYYAVVKQYLPNGQARMEYADHAFETVDLHYISWEHTRKGQKSFLPFSTKPPNSS